MADDEVDQQVIVPGLYGSVQLQAECEAQGLKLGDETRKFLVYGMLKTLGPTQSQKLIDKFASEGLVTWDEETYEVESVLDHYTDENGQTYFLIKWHGWNSKYNTWEPKDNLECENLLDEYMKISKGNTGKRKNMPLPMGIMKKQRIDEVFEKIVSSKVMTTMSPMEMINFSSPIKKAAQAKGLIRAQGQRIPLRPFRRKENKTTKIKTKIYMQAALKEWESHVNNIIKDFDRAPITIINEVDLEGPPDNFFFINTCKEGPGVTIPRDPLVGCECDDCYESRTSCCAVESDSKFAYTRAGRVRLPQGTPIYECNSRCNCGPDCINRVVQNGRNLKICIFRTANGRGWGVKSLQKVKKGSFVMEYVGEVISHEEAERRGQEYDAAGRTYLFDLDFTDTDAPFTVDAGIYGNAAHFINHSCDPNLEVFCVWVDTLDPRLPRICLFAKRDIQRGEEFTFDYMCGQPTGNDNGDEKTTECSGHGKTTEESITSSSNSLSSELSSTSKVLGASSPDTANGLNTDAANTPPPSENGDEKKENPGLSGKLPNYSMVCQCGAANCRKYLF